MNLGVVLAAAVIVVPGAFAQPAPEATKLEVASIRLHTGPPSFVDLSTSGPRVSASALTLKELVTDAYHLRQDQVVGGPPWMGTDRYDIVAKAEGSGMLTPEQVQQLLQALLRERFGFTGHSETRETQSFALTIAKSGSKLKDADNGEGKAALRMTKGADGTHLTSWHSTMGQLAQMLSQSSGRPVVDETGLTEKYAFELVWDASNMGGGEIPSVFTAVEQQLGLKLEPRRVPFEVLVVDRLERPSEN